LAKFFSYQKIRFGPGFLKSYWLINLPFYSFQVRLRKLIWLGFHYCLGWEIGRSLFRW